MPIAVASTMARNATGPMPGATADGAEEQAVMQFERDGVNAMLKRDLAFIDRGLAKEYTSVADGKVNDKANLTACYQCHLPFAKDDYLTNMAKLAGKFPSDAKAVARTGAGVDQHRRPAPGGDHDCDAGPDDALEAPDVKKAGREDGAGVPR